MVPGLVDFFLFGLTSPINMRGELGSSFKRRATHMADIKLIDSLRAPINRMLEETTRFEPYAQIFELAEKASQILSLCNTMGEGWLLTAEMVDLIETGCPNIVCCSPFACLPNHVVGKSVIKRLRQMHPESNIVAVDYDPGASEVNQLNRIKLMMGAGSFKLVNPEDPTLGYEPVDERELRRGATSLCHAHMNAAEPIRLSDAQLRMIAAAEAEAAQRARAKAEDAEVERSEVARS